MENAKNNRPLSIRASLLLFLPIFVLGCNGVKRDRAFTQGQLNPNGAFHSTNNPLTPPLSANGSQNTGNLNDPFHRTGAPNGSVPGAGEVAVPGFDNSRQDGHKPGDNITITKPPGTPPAAGTTAPAKPATPGAPEGSVSIPDAAGDMTTDFDNGTDALCEAIKAANIKAYTDLKNTYTAKMTSLADLQAKQKANPVDATQTLIESGIAETNKLDTDVKSAQARAERWDRLQSSSKNDGVSDACKEALVEYGFKHAKSGSDYAELGFKVGVYKINPENIKSLVESSADLLPDNDLNKEGKQNKERDAVYNLLKKPNWKDSFYSDTKKSILNTALALLLSMDAIHNSYSSDQIFRSIRQSSDIVGMAIDGVEEANPRPVNVSGGPNKMIFYDPRKPTITMGDICGVYKNNSGYVNGSEYLALAEGWMVLADPVAKKSINFKLFNYQRDGTPKDSSGVFSLFDNGQLVAQTLDLTELNGISSTLVEKLGHNTAPTQASIASSGLHHLVVAMAVKDMGGLAAAIGNVVGYRIGNAGPWRLLDQHLAVPNEILGQGIAAKDGKAAVPAKSYAILTDDGNNAEQRDANKPATPPSGEPGK